MHRDGCALAFCKLPLTAPYFVPSHQRSVQDELGRELFNAADNNRLAEARELLASSTAHINWNKNDVSVGTDRDFALCVLY
jgi:hypothetical protein